MPIVSGKYVNPNWVNGGPPAINDTELNAMSDTLVSSETHIGTVANLTTTAKTDLVVAINEVNAGVNAYKTALNAIGLDIENGAFVISPVTV